MKKIVPRLLRLIVVIILIQTLRLKFTAHPDSVYIFTKVGLEPLGRIITGIIEAIAVILLIFPKTVWIGALLTLGIISSAIMIHFTKIGIEINNDGGLLFFTAVITFILSAIILWTKRKEIRFF